MGFVQIDRVLLNFYRFRHDVGSARDTGGKINLIYLDFAKAFDSVPHNKLVGKHQSYHSHGISACSC